MAQTRQRVRNGPRRACAGWAVKGHLGHSPSLDLWWEADCNSLLRQVFGEERRTNGPEKPVR
jgi:hypothetical protein